MELISHCIAMLEWEKVFLNTSVNEKIVTFSTNIWKVLNNFIPHETIVCNDRHPPGFDNKIRLLIKEKTTTYKWFRQNCNSAYWQHHLKVLQGCLNNSIKSSKEKCYNRPLIPPLFFSNFILDFKHVY